MYFHLFIRQKELMQYTLLLDDMLENSKYSATQFKVHRFICCFCCYAPLLWPHMLGNFLSITATI